MYKNTLIKSLMVETPEEIKEVVASDTTLAALEEISELYQLSSDQRGLLGLEVTFALIGLTPKDKLTYVLQEKLQISEEISNGLFKAINEKIISEIPERTLLAQQEFAQKKLRESVNSSSSSLEFPPQNLPMVEKGEVVHDVPHFSVPATVPRPAQPFVPAPLPKSVVEEKLSKPIASAPSYKPGEDPYREPAE